MSSPANALAITVPEAGKLLGLGRDASYAAAGRGEIPTLQFGRRLVVPVPMLMQLLGSDTRPAGDESSRAAGDESTRDS